jgi:tetratricopeptide (TPR) repeat protein
MKTFFFDGIDALIWYQLIIRVNGNYQFGHDKIRQTVYAHLPEEKKKRYHARSANFFASKPEEDQKDIIAAIARHFAAAGQNEKATEYSLKAAELAERNGAEWDAFDHYRNAAGFLETQSPSPDRDIMLLKIYEKAAEFSSAAWTDAPTCLNWLQKAIDHYTAIKEMDKVFGLSLSYVVSSSITSNYAAARRKISEIIETCGIHEQTLEWAVLFGAGVCLTDWYEGRQNDCFEHAVSAITIFENTIDTLADDMYPAYAWSLFWRDKARAYLGKPVVMKNVEKIRQLTEMGKSDQTIYWHTLTAVGARAAYSGRWTDLLDWKRTASKLSREMGKIYWFECWISHSYLYGALHYGEFSQIENHIQRVEASPDPYQVRLAWLFRGMFKYMQKDFNGAVSSLEHFFGMENKSRDNSFIEGFVWMAKTYLATGEIEKAEKIVNEGFQLTASGAYENPLYRMQFLQIKAKVAAVQKHFTEAEQLLQQSMELAVELDNPIQMAFIHKLSGKLYLAQKQKDQAAGRLKMARDLFLSLTNKYQAGKIMGILEALEARETQPVRSLPSSGDLCETVFESDEEVILLDETVRESDTRKT